MKWNARFSPHTVYADSEHRTLTLPDGICGSNNSVGERILSSALRYWLCTDRTPTVTTEPRDNQGSRSRSKYSSISPEKVWICQTWAINVRVAFLQAGTVPVREREKKQIKGNKEKKGAEKVAALQGKAEFLLN